MNVFIKETIKLKFKIAYGAGYIKGFVCGTLGFFHDPTQEEIKANNIYQRNLEKIDKILNKEVKEA